MKLATQLRILFLLMLCISLGGAALSVWSFGKASNHVTRVSLAYDAHASVLSLKSHTYQLFKQYGDALMIGDLDKGTGERNLIARIRSDIAEIRATIGAEIELVGEEEVEELEELSKIEIKIEELINALERISKNDNPDARATQWGELSQILEGDIDRDFHKLITEFLDEEVSEVEETLEQVAREVKVYNMVAVFFALIAIIATLVSVWILSRNVSYPLSLLSSGVKKFGSGDLDHRVILTGKDEISSIAQTFNVMAQSISDRTEALSSAKLTLEKAVADRTSKLEKALADIKRAESNRRQMLTDVSHELRTPLTVIRGEADVALRGGDKSAKVYREALNRAREAASHTSTLVDDLLFIARSEAGQVRLKIGQIDLVSVIRKTMDTFGLDAGLVTDLESAPMRGDPDRLRQAVLVLLENARHHGGKEIVLRLNRSPHGFQITIEDNGPGMTNEEKANAFERFFRGSNTAENYREGVGLGLPIAQAIAKAHQGTVELADRSGGGLLATISLPSKPTLKTVA
ncbi:MAG: HAMP domain-containing sensor histidine kinase [Pseudomonadota bacterium]